MLNSNFSSSLLFSSSNTKLLKSVVVTSSSHGDLVSLDEQEMDMEQNLLFTFFRCLKNLEDLEKKKFSFSRYTFVLGKVEISYDASFEELSRLCADLKSRKASLLLREKRKIPKPSLCDLVWSNEEAMERGAIEKDFKKERKLAFLLSVYLGKESWMEVLFEKEEGDRDSLDRHCLTYAAMGGHVQCFKFLMSKGKEKTVFFVGLSHFSLVKASKMLTVSI